jgi:DNA-binding GntR family transcriptional regulator
VSEKLREAIYDMRFTPGTRLVERELCEMTGVSRTLIREALRELEADGLVEVGPKGPIVAVLTPDDARSVYDVRAALEGLAGRRCAENATPVVIAALRDALDDVERVYADESVSGSQKLAAKTRFYQALFAGAGNPVLTDLLRVLHARINLLRAAFAEPSRTMKSLSEMRRIVAAIEKRDADAAARLCVEHVENAALVAFTAMDRGTAASRPKLARANSRRSR